MRTSTFDSPNRNIFVLSITVFLVDTVLSSWLMVLPLYLEDLGAGMLEVGFCYALINVGWYMGYNFLEVCFPIELAERA